MTLRGMLFRDLMNRVLNRRPALLALPYGKGLSMNPLEKLKKISVLATSDRLDEFLTEHGVPELDDSLPLPAHRKFGSRPAFDRNSFDIAAYTAEIERHFKK